MKTQSDELYQKLAHPQQEAASRQNIEIRMAAHYIDFIKEKRIIRISVKHFIYGNDIINSFSYYFEAVRPIEFNGHELVDYSTPRYHDVVGFDLFPVFFPSLAEPVVTTRQYLDFANLKSGNNVIDLGAYAGLTSILFKELVGKDGVVVALDADAQNIHAARINFSRYEKAKGQTINLIHAAAWKHCDGISFSSEGNMGAAATEIVGARRGTNVFVESLTLSKIMKASGLDSIDFIKCDIEGAEAVIFEDKDFLKNHKPKIIIETHLVDNKETTEKCIADLERYGYRCKRIHQTGVTLPLLECHPPSESMGPKQNSFFERTKHPYYIMAPAFRQSSGGIRALHYLCHALNEIGHEAYVVTEKNRTSPYLRTPELTQEIRQQHQQSGRTPIAVYPEVAHGNWLGESVVARWLLNKPGHLGGDKLHHENEILFYWDEWILDDSIVADKLTVPIIDTRIFNNDNNNNARSGICYYANKYLKFHDKISQTLIDGGISLCQNIQRSPQEIADIFRASEVFYCYEPSSMVLEAYACGCPVAYIDTEYLGNFNLNEQEIIKVKESEIGRIRIPNIDSIKFKEYLDDASEKSWTQIDHFIQITQANAEAHYQRTLRQEASIDEALAAYQGKNLEVATKILTALLDEHPQDPLPPAYLSFICAARGMKEEAALFIEQAKTLAPTRHDLVAALGEAFLKAGDPDSAVGYLNKAVSAQPDLFAAYPALAQSLHLTQRSEEAASLLRATANLPSSAQENIRTTLLEILAQQGNIAEFSNVCLRYSGGIADDLLAVRCLARFEASGEPMVEALTGIQAQLSHLFSDTDMDCADARPSDRPLKIAFMLSDFSREQQLGQLAALLRHLPAEQFITALIINAPDTGNEDAAQTCLLVADKSVAIYGQDDFIALEMINAYAPDVLVDLDSYDPADRLSVLVQARAGLKLLWGEAPMPPLAPNCMPLRGIRVTDDNMLPGIALPEMGEYYALPDIPIVAQEHSATGTVFGCLTSAIRIGSDGWRLFAEVLLASPNSRLVINLKDLGDSAREFIARQFENAGVTAMRLRFVHAHTAEELCRHWGDVQIGLASPVDAGDLALPACLWMGRPYIALIAGLPWSRRPAALLECVGAAAWIADTPESYVALARQTPPAPDAILRQRMQAALLNDPVAFARGFAASITAVMQPPPARPLSS